MPLAFTQEDFLVLKYAFTQGICHQHREIFEFFLARFVVGCCYNLLEFC